MNIMNRLLILRIYWKIFFTYKKIVVRKRSDSFKFNNESYIYDNIDLYDLILKYKHIHAIRITFGNYTTYKHSPKNTIIYIVASSGLFNKLHIYRIYWETSIYGVYNIKQSSLYNFDMCISNVTIGKYKLYDGRTCYLNERKLRYMDVIIHKLNLNEEYTTIEGKQQLINLVKIATIIEL